MAELETPIPIIRLWSCLLLPLQGEISDRQADRLFDEVLRAIDRHGTRGLVLDLSGVWVMDSHLCSILARIATAAGFMGSRCIVTGMSPEIVMTLQAMDIGLGSIETTLSMESALERLGIRIDEDLARTSERHRAAEIDDLLGALDDAPAPTLERSNP
jgi:rsbT antagonist protein RsbS